GSGGWNHGAGDSERRENFARGPHDEIQRIDRARATAADFARHAGRRDRHRFQLRDLRNGMGHAYSPPRSNVAPRLGYGQKSSVLGRSKKPIRPQNRSANHLKLRSSQRRRWRRQPFAQARDRTARKSERTLSAALVIRNQRRDSVAVDEE